MKTDISEIKVAADRGRLFILLNVRTPTSHTIGRQRRSTVTKAHSMLRRPSGVQTSRRRSCAGDCGYLWQFDEGTARELVPEVYIFNYCWLMIGIDVASYCFVDVFIVYWFFVEEYV